MHPTSDKDPADLWFICLYLSSATLQTPQANQNACAQITNGKKMTVNRDIF